MAGLDGFGKSHPNLGFDPRTVRPEARRYTDNAIHARNQPRPDRISSMITATNPVHKMMQFINSLFILKSTNKGKVVENCVFDF
jgi:hypothetical protein